MGIYLNPDNEDFQQSLNSKIYVDKSELIAYTNGILRTEQKYICVSRPRRFGKSMAAEMLTAYYNRGCDSKQIFKGLKIEKDPDSEIPEIQTYLQIVVDIDGIEPPLEWAAKVKDSISNDLEKAVLSKPDEQSASLEEAYIKAASRNDEGRMAVINYVKSI